MFHRRKPLKIAAITSLLLIAAALACLFYSWSSTRAVIDKFTANPGNRFTPQDTDTFLRFFGGKFLSRPPWQTLTPAEERQLVLASFKQIELRGEPTVYAILQASHHEMHNFAELPALASDFLNRRDDPAALALSYTADDIIPAVLTETRIRELLSKPASEMFQMSLIQKPSRQLLTATATDFTTAGERGILAKNAIKLLNSRRATTPPP